MLFSFTINRPCVEFRRAVAILSGVCLYLTFAYAVADENRFAAADQAARDGRLQEMQRIYDSILVEQPDNVRALTGQATALAWQQQYPAAEKAYLRALAIQPNDVEARAGLGYAYAWNGQYAKAHTEFNRALALAPEHLGAHKGVAYSYLWSGDANLALESLDIAASIAPDDAEIWEVSGYSHVQLDQNREAIVDFDHALRLDPSRISTHAARAEAYRSAPVLEVSVRGGSTSGAGNGLRQVEVAHWLSRHTRLSGRYDNSLGLDNASIADRGADAPGYFAALSHRFTGGIGVQFEGGRRELGAGNQRIALLQGTLETPRGVLRVGGQVGNHDQGHTDKLIFAGYNMPLANEWRLDPVFYISESGAADDSEWRTVVNVEKRWSANLVIGGFAGGGKIAADVPEFAGSTRIAGSWVSYDPGGRFAITVSARYEQTPVRDFTVAEIGFTFRLPGNGGMSR